VSDLAEAVIGKTNQPLLEAVAYLNNETPASTIIETYESELLFFLTVGTIILRIRFMWNSFAEKICPRRQS
jgi:hypothetical protein